MNRTSLRLYIIVFAAGTLLFSGSLGSAGAVERSLLGIHIYANVKAVIRKFGNPTYVLTAGQSYEGSNSVTTGTDFGGAGQADTGVPANGLPPLQPQGGPVPAFGQPQLPGTGNEATPTAPSDAGEVTLVYQKSNGITYQFLLSTQGSVVQITALGYSDPLARTTKAIHFGSSYSQLINRYGYPENQSETDDGVRIVDYRDRAHVAFELLNNTVVGIVVAAID